MPPENNYHRLATAFLASYWAILPEKYDAICAFIEANVKGIGTDPKAFSFSEPKAYLTDSGVKVIPLRGVMSKRMNLLGAFSGGMSTEITGKAIQAAFQDDEVKAIVLDLDSPGGMVDGSFTLADMVFENRGIKPIVAFADGDCCSAACLVASACDSVITNETGSVGSIGVLTTHTDRSKADAKKGLVRTPIFAGSYKTAGSGDHPLDPKSKAYIQGQVDNIYALFIDKVSRNRGVTTKRALSMADGKVFIGAEALDVGLVDQIGERGDAIALAESRIQSPSPKQSFTGRFQGIRPPSFHNRKEQPHE